MISEKIRYFLGCSFSKKRKLKKKQAKEKSKVERDDTQISAG